MKEIKHKIERLDWEEISLAMHQNGYAQIRDLLNQKQCEELIEGYDQNDRYRKTVRMERHRFGFGEYKYFNYPLPDLVHQIRTQIYPRLAEIANLWYRSLKINTMFPMEHAELLRQCLQHKQMLATPLILRYGKGGFNTLHQDIYGDLFFPLQMVLFLNEPDEDYSAGEFVLTQQIPRVQTRAIVLRPKRGDALIFASNFKPELGNKGYYRVNMKHGVSEVTSGIRHTLGIIFHDALS